MQPITYREKPTNTWVRIAGPGAVLLTIVALILHQLRGSEIGLVIALGTAAVIVSLAAFFYICRAVFSNPNSLTIDAEGLTWITAGGHHRWLWWDLSSFELIEGHLLGDRLTFKVNGRSGDQPEPPFTAFLSQGVTHPALADIYEVPLAEIAQRLQDYRRQALSCAPTEPAFA